MTVLPDRDDFITCVDFIVIISNISLMCTAALYATFVRLCLE